MVGAGSPEIQWCTTAGCTTKYDDRVGCFLTGLGSNVKRPGTENRWPMVSQRARDAHQLPGVVSSFSGNPSICQGEEWHQYSGQNRQHLGQGLHKSLWGNIFMANECSDCEDVEVVHRSSNLSDGLPGAENQVADMEVTDSQGSLRLDASSSSFFTDREEDGPTRGGYVCILADTPAPSLLQLEAGSGFTGNRCLYTELESVSWVCQSPMVSHISNIGKDSIGESLGDLGGANVEDTIMVSPPPSATVWLPSLDFNTGECSDFTNQGGVHHASGSASVGRLAIIRQQCRSGGLSQLLASSRRSKTTSTYESLFKKWDSWCQEWGRDPIRGPIVDVLNCLAELFEQGYQYRSSNSYQSAISSVHQKVDGVEVGKHPLITRGF